MPQFERPDNDFNNPGSWTDQGGGSTNIYQAIDEATIDDADFVRSPLAPSSSVYVTRLSDAEDPQVSTGHILQNRYAKDAAGGLQIDLVAQLRQGYVSEASQGTLIVSRTFTNITEVFTTDSYTLSAVEADAITNYNDLFIRYSANQV